MVLDQISANLRMIPTTVLENISNAIATLRSLDIGINDEHILKGIEKIDNLPKINTCKDDIQAHESRVAEIEKKHSVSAIWRKFK